MADQQGPSLNIPFDSRNLEQLKRYQDAAKSARREVKALQKEMEEATRQGRAIDQKAIDRLRTLENIERKATGVLKAEKEMSVARKESLRHAERERAEIARGEASFSRGARFAKKMAYSPMAHRLISGGSLSMQDARMFATDPYVLQGAGNLARRGGVALGQMGGMGRTAGKALGSIGRGLGALAASPTGMLALQVTVDRVQKIVEERASIRAAQEKVTNQVGSRQISAAEGRFFDKNMERFQWTGDKGETSLKNLEELQAAGSNIYSGKVKTAQIGEALKDAAGWGTLANMQVASAGKNAGLLGGVLQGGLTGIRANNEALKKAGATDPKALQAAIEKGVKEKSIRLGRALTGDESQRAVNETMATFFKDMPVEFVEAFTKRVNEMAATKDAQKPIRELTGAQILNERFSGDLENFNNFQRSQKRWRRSARRALSPARARDRARQEPRSPPRMSMRPPTLQPRNAPAC